MAVTRGAPHCHHLQNSRRANRHIPRMQEPSIEADASAAPCQPACRWAQKLDSAKIDGYGFIIEDGEENKLRIEPDVQQLQQQEFVWKSVLSNWASMVPQEIKNNTFNGIFHGLRGTVWQLLAMPKSRDPALFTTLLAKEDNKHMDQIRLDLDRTFTTHIFFQRDGQGQKELFNVLKAYAHFNPTIGYCQGMSYIASVLLLFMPPEDAFWLFTNLIGKLDNLHDSKMSGLVKLTNQFEKLIRVALPTLSKHLISKNMFPLLYATPWFVAMFTGLKCWDTVLQIFDLFFVEGLMRSLGTTALLRYGLTFLKLAEETLLQLPTLEKLMSYLLNLPHSVIDPHLAAEVAKTFDMDKLIALAALEKDRPATPLKRRNSISKRKVASPSLLTKLVTPIKQSFLDDLLFKKSDPEAPTDPLSPSFSTPQIGVRKRRAVVPADVTPKRSQSSRNKSNVLPNKTFSNARALDKENDDFGSPAFKDFSTPKKAKRGGSAVRSLLPETHSVKSSPLSPLSPEGFEMGALLPMSPVERSASPLAGRRPISREVMSPNQFSRSLRTKK